MTKEAKRHGDGSAGAGFDVAFFEKFLRFCGGVLSVWTRIAARVFI